MSVVQVLLQAERLKIASSFKEASTLTAELLAFKVSISLKGHDSYGNDAGPWWENIRRPSAGCGFVCLVCRVLQAGHAGEVTKEMG